MLTRRSQLFLAFLAFLVLLLVTLACARGLSGEEGYFIASGTRLPLDLESGQPAYRKSTPGGPILSPTPDDPHHLPQGREQAERYTVKGGDTLGTIAQNFGVSVNQIAEANQIANINLLEVGQELLIPAPTPESLGPDFKIIPDSELVYGPASIEFELEAFVQEQGGFLAGYSEEVEGQMSSGAAIVQRVARNFSVNPRLLLAVLEYQSAWVTQADPERAPRNFPIGVRNPERKGLYRELAWAANTLNRGYYLWRANGISSWVLKDEATIPAANTINAGTAAVQYLFAQLLATPAWRQAVSAEGLFAAYNQLFGYPFHYSVEPLLPGHLRQPRLQLPFEEGVTWSFTGGPHGGWDSGSAWAALDFAPPAAILGCTPSDEWVTAMADGVVVRTGEGQVVQDLDGDGYEQTGWVIFYMHIENRERVAPGTSLRAGERVGHPSCEGGVSNGTHLHVARKYNGEWIPADQQVPFDLEGWISSGDGNEYDGFLTRGAQVLEAYAGIAEINQISR